MNTAQEAFQTQLRADVASQLEEVTSGLTATVTSMANQMTADGNSREVAANEAMSTLTATAAANTAALTTRMSALDASNTAPRVQSAANCAGMLRGVRIPYGPPGLQWVGAKAFQRIASARMPRHSMPF